MLAVFSLIICKLFLLIGSSLYETSLQGTMVVVFNILEVLDLCFDEYN